jgi:thioredoxin-related protein
MIKKYSHTIKKVLFITIIFVILYFITCRSVNTATIGINTKIDSINLISKNLEIKQKQFDSLIVLENLKINKLDSEIDGVSNKTIIIKEYYHEKISNINKYTTTQLDSFFSKRYGY